MSWIRQGSYAPGTTQNITTSGSSQQSSAMANATAIVRVATTEATYIELGADPTANAVTSLMMPSGAIEFFAVEGGVTKIAVLQVANAGVASITQLSTV